MFKPLLKTIPSLSGNMKLVCNLEGYNINPENTFVYDCDVNKAYLTSISSNLYDKNIPINLKNNSFEYDVKKFYLYYADVFYKTNFNYSKINIPVIDFSSNINNSNLDFKYGCKRVSYSKSGNQFAFFAPIYIEGLDDLKGKYFIIKCVFNKVYQLTKYIKIKLSNINENNKLADYLCRYAEKIDDKVIYCSDSYKNIYYGIDLKHGGFIKVEDNISSNLYNKYFTINDFDATLNNGFKRNYMMMKQIIPLSFYFDPNDLLYDFEKNIYNNAEVIISGRWYNEDEEIPFYDFSDDYSIYEEDIYNLYYDNVFKYITTGYNIMDLKYPACNEASSENYKYVNTVAKNYNRWKLKYSNDLYPYIINNNYAFSFNQNSLYTYKEFPIMYSPIKAYAKLVSNTEYNMLFDYNDIYGKDGYTIINNRKKYFELYNNNFCGNFFDIFVYNKTKDNNEETINVHNVKYWYNEKTKIPKDFDKIDEDKIVGYEYINLNNLTYENLNSIDFFDDPSISQPRTIIPYITDLTNRYSVVFEATNFGEKLNDYIYYHNPSKCDGWNSSVGDSYSLRYTDDIKIFINIIDKTISRYTYFLNEYNQENSTNFAICFYNIICYDKETNDLEKLIMLNTRNIKNDGLYNILEIVFTEYDNSKYNNFKEEKIDIFNNIYDKFWTNVDKDGKVYHKGILYDLNTVYNNNLNMDYKIDKFGLFVKPRFEYTLSSDFNDKFKESKHVFTYNFTAQNKYYDIEKLYNYYDLRTKSSYLLNYQVVVKDENGLYVDISRLRKQYEYNIYFDLNDIYIVNLINNNTFIDLRKAIYINGEEVELEIIDGYKIIDVYNVSNIYDILFSELINIYGQSNKRNEDSIIFRNRKFIEIEDIYWAIDKLYFSIYPNKTKYSLIDNYSLLNTIKDNEVNIVLYYKTSFIRDDSNNRRYLECLNINGLDNLQKFYYLNGLYDRKNKILYTAPSFKLLDDVDNQYGNLLDNHDKNIIYIDPYNLSKLYHTYIYKEFEESNEEFEEYYVNFLNIDHIRLYFDKLYKNYDLSGTLSIDNIYIKVRNFNNIMIDLDDSANTNYSTINIQDDYIPIKNFGINNIGNIASYIVYDTKLKCFSFTDEYINKFISLYKDWVYNSYNYSDDYPQSEYQLIFETLNKYNIKNFEICFKKEMMKLNKDLYNLIINRNNDAIFKDLYLYHIYDPKEYYCQMNYVDNKKYYIDIDKHQQDNQNILEYINNTNSIEKCLYPYFNDVYEEGRTNTKIYSDYFINSIIRSNYEGNEEIIRYKYNEPSINFLAYIPFDSNIDKILTQQDLNKIELIDDEVEKEKKTIELSQEKLTNYRYSLINDVNDTFVSKEDFITYNIVNNPENINEYSNLLTYNYNGTYYGFYIINSYFDNTNNTLNIQNEDLDNINCVDYINGIHVSEILENSYSYLGTMYKNILPYFKNSNPTKFVMNNVDTLIKPQIYKLKNAIKQYPNVDGDIAYSYTLYNNNKSSNIELSRYFNSIVPYTPEAKYISSYYLYYKDTNKIIENDFKVERKPYIMYKEQIDINRFSYISYFDINENIRQYVPTEYKYYNHNRFFNLEKEIKIDIKGYFTEDKIIEIENNQEYIFGLFKNYINNNDFDILPERDKNNNYLFLYKKYEIKFMKDFKHINSENNKEYSLTIKFNLL